MIQKPQTPQAVPMRARSICGYPAMGVIHRTPDVELEAMYHGANFGIRTAMIEAYRPRMQVIEVGSWVGESLIAITVGARDSMAKHIHQEEWPIATLDVTAVDTFTGSSSDDTGKYAQCIGGYLQDIWLQNTDQLTHGCDIETNVECIVGRSTAAATIIHEQKNHADFISIDAEHTYEACLEDIQAWWKVLHQGSYMMGHDYCEAFPGVMRAVDECAQELAHCSPFLLEGSSVWMLYKGPDR